MCIVDSCTHCDTQASVSRPCWICSPPPAGCNPQLTSLGLTVIDTIRFGDGTVVDDVLGGSGTYCSLGARLFSSGTPQSIAFKILAGFDFPELIESKIRDWQIDLAIQKDSKWQSVRGLLEYEDTTFGPKKFRYTTPVLQVEPRDLRHTTALSASAFHFLCHPNKVQDLVAELILYRGSSDRPSIIREPAPPACTAENLEACLRAVQVIDIFSPNHLELLNFCGRDQSAFSQSVIEECASLFLKEGIGPQKAGMVVIRAGEHGCMMKTSMEKPAVWLPPYYTSEQRDKIVDTTGAGNAFLGAFVRGYQETTNYVEAACYGTVAASFMLEQIGTPEMTRSDNGTTFWNGEDPFVRLDAFKRKCLGR